MKKTIHWLGVSLLVLGILSAPAAAREPTTFHGRAAKIAQDEDIVFGNHALININNMSMWFKDDGYSAGNPYTDNSGVTYPRGTDQVIYRDGLVWGGKVIDGDEPLLRVGGSTYSQGTVPGRITSKGVAAPRDDATTRIYRIRRDYKTADLRQETAEYLDVGLSEVSDDEIAQLRAQYDKDWREWPAAWGAPFYDNDGDGVYTPQFDADGNPVLDGTADEPGVASADQVAWLVVNDLDQGATTQMYGAKPIGIEEQILMWAYARTDALGEVIFKKYTLVYKGTEDTPDDARIEDMYFSQWSDPDLGDYGDDFVGCDVGLSLGFVYNAFESDSHYDPFGLAPPAAGYDFLQGPMVPVYVEGEDDEGNPIQVLDESSEAIFNFERRVGYRNLPMTAFVYFASGGSITDPEQNNYNGTLEWYGLLRGYEPTADIDNPQPFNNALTGEETKFTFDGDPVRVTGWNDGIPLPAGDRRMVLATGPFELALNDTQEVVVALVGGIGSDRLRSVSQMKFNDQFVQDAYNGLFEVPKAPSTPKVSVAELDGAILLDWGRDEAAVAATEGPGSFEFEGYNVYQFPSSEGNLDQATKLNTYDLTNGVATILGIALDEDSGVVLDVPLQVGADAGIRRSKKVTRDAIRGGPLVNGQEYYFAVTAYNRNTSAGAAVTTLESPPQVKICVPQAPPPGMRYLSESAQMVEGDHAAGASDGAVAAMIVDPTQTTGDSYQVSFGLKDVMDDDGEVVGSETVWSLINTTRDSTVVLADQSAQLATTDAPGPYIGSDGFEVRVAGPPNGMKDWAGPALPFAGWLASADAADENGDGAINVGDFAEQVSHSSDTRWFTWAGGADAWGLEGFSGAMSGDLNHQWFNATTLTAADLRTVELRFTSVDSARGENYFKPVDWTNENVSWAYRYLRNGAAAAPAPEELTTVPQSAAYDWTPYLTQQEPDKGGYMFADRRQICLSAWDVESDPPRRLEVGFLENNLAEGLVNGAYGPADHNEGDNLAVREWLFIFDTDYTVPADAADGAGAQDGNSLLKDNSLYLANDTDVMLPLMWWLVAGRRGQAVPEDGASFLLVANHVNTPADAFTFTVPGTVASDSLETADFGLINVFPNPYYAANTAETSAYEHFITFSHLPERATIRIYDLSGALVRKLTEDDKDSVGDQFLRWDLQNHNDLPVASGLYIAHIDLPDLNKSKVLKFVVVQEQQFLEYF